MTGDVEIQNLTLFGAIPALTVNLVASCTLSRICCTHFPALSECSSQYLVMLAKSQRLNAASSKDKDLTSGIPHHSQRRTWMDRIVSKSPLFSRTSPDTLRNCFSRRWVQDKAFSQWTLISRTAVRCCSVAALSKISHQAFRSAHRIFWPRTMP
jgi:hypothetical protein